MRGWETGRQPDLEEEEDDLVRLRPEEMHTKIDKTTDKTTMINGGTGIWRTLNLSF